MNSFPVVLTIISIFQKPQTITSISKKIMVICNQTNKVNPITLEQEIEEELIKRNKKKKRKKYF